MSQCVQCQQEIPSDAQSCPHCHTVQQESAASQIGGAVIFLALVFALCGGFIALVVYYPVVRYCTLAVVAIFVLGVLLMSFGEESRKVLHRSRRRFATAFKMTGKRLAEDLHLVKRPRADQSHSQDVAKADFSEE